MASFGSKVGFKKISSGFRGTTEKPPTMRIPSQRRNYSKPEMGAENPLTAMGTGGTKPPSPSFGQTGLTGES